MLRASVYLHGAYCFLEADSRSESQEILHLSLNPKTNYHVRHNPSPVFIVSQINPIEIIKPYSFQYYNTL